MIPRVEVDRNASIRARTPGIAVRRYTVYYTHPREQRLTDGAYIKLTRPFAAFSNNSDKPPQYGSAFTQQTAHPLPGVLAPTPDGVFSWTERGDGFASIHRAAEKEGVLGK